jgi:hypothetical protein
MSIFRKKDKNPDETSLMLKDLEKNSKEEIQKIEFFFKFLNEYRYKNAETLNMNLEDFLEYLVEIEEETNDKIQNQQKSYQNKINLDPLFQKYYDLKKIKEFIHSVIKKSQTKIYNLPEINFQKTKLKEFINIIEERKNYLNEILKP